MAGVESAKLVIALHCRHTPPAASWCQLALTAPDLEGGETKQRRAQRYGGIFVARWSGDRQKVLGRLIERIMSDAEAIGGVD
jgi:hypothetical protein